MDRRLEADTPSNRQQNKLTYINDVIGNLFGQLKKVNAENDHMKKLIALLLHFKYLLQLAVKCNDFDKQWKPSFKDQNNFKDDYSQCLNNFASLVEELPFVSEIENQYQNSSDKADLFCSFNDLPATSFSSENSPAFDYETYSYTEDTESNIDFPATSNFLELQYDDNSEKKLVSTSNEKPKNPRGRPRKGKKRKNSVIGNGRVKRVKRIRIRTTTKKPKTIPVASTCSSAKASVPVANSNKTAYERLNFLKRNPLYIYKSSKKVAPLQAEMMPSSQNLNNNDSQSFCSPIVMDHSSFDKSSEASRLFYDVCQNGQEKQYSCGVAECDFVHNKKNCIETHIWKHFNLKPFGCSQCEHRTDSRKSLLKHALQVHQITADLLPYMDYLKINVNGNDRSKVYACKFSPSCTYEASNTSVLMEHLKVHLDLSPFKCAYCDMRFSDLIEMKKHLVKKHKRPSFYTCLNGNCTFTIDQPNSESMLDHIKEHHQFVENVPDLFQSANFNQSYISESKKQQTISYWNHASGTMVHYGNVGASGSAVDFQQPQFSCSYKNCFYKSYNSRIELKEHEYNFHMKLPFKCPENSCIENVFETNDGLNRHLIERHGFSPFSCGIDDCNRLFVNSVNLYCHMKEEHSDASIPCSKCTKSFKSGLMMLKHYRKSHLQGEYPCRQKSCKYVGNFRAELESHTGLVHNNRMKKCPIPECGQTMVRCQFQRHMDRHNNIKSNMCSWPDCGKTFIDLKSLKDHLRIHLNFKRFVCKWPDCGYASEQRSNAIKHVRIRHLKLPYTKKEQLEKKITSKQQPRDYVEILPDQINL